MKNVNDMASLIDARKEKSDAYYEYYDRQIKKQKQHIEGINKEIAVSYNRCALIQKCLNITIFFILFLMGIIVYSL